jgi:hypothetical protein
VTNWEKENKHIAKRTGTTTRSRFIALFPLQGVLKDLPMLPAKSRDASKASLLAFAAIAAGKRISPFDLG